MGGGGRQGRVEATGGHRGAGDGQGKWRRFGITVLAQMLDWEGASSRRFCCMQRQLDGLLLTTSAATLRLGTRSRADK